MAIELADLTLFICGIVVGMIALLIITAFFMSKDFYITPKSKGSKFDLLNMIDDTTGEKLTFINTNSAWANIGVLLVTFQWILRRNKSTVVVSNRIVHIVAFITILLLFILVFGVAVDSIFYVQTGE